MAARELLGREQELGALGGFLDAATAGPATFVIEGEAGIGKTSLWSETVRRAADLGMQVYSCRSASAEAKLSFTALSDLLEPVPDTAFAALPSPQRHALEVALLRTDPRGRTPDARAAATAVRSLLMLLAVDSPVLVAIDDVQWLDVSSARALDFALRRMRDVPVSLLVARRAGMSESAAKLENALVDADLLPIGPLSLAATHELLKRRFGRSAPRRLLIRVHEAAAGNPFFALELGRVVLEHDHRPADPLPVPDDLAELVLRRVRKLRPSAREALLVVAAAGRPDTPLVEAVLDDARVALDEAKDAGLLHEENRLLALEHPLYGAAVYSAASDQQRREVHRRLAKVAGDPEERARHLALAASGPDESVADALRSAAEAAQARGALDAAAELIELALRLTSDATSESAGELRVDLALLVRLTGDADRARTMFEELVEETSGRVQARALVEFGGTLYWTEGSIAGVECVERALVAAGDAPMLQARCHADIASYCDFDLEKAYHHAREALRLCTEAGEAVDPFVHAEALSLAARSGLMLGKGLRLADVDRAIEIERRATQTEPSVAVVGRITTTSGQWLRYVDDFAGARARLENARREALEEGDESALPNILQHLAQTELWNGNWTLALQHAELACEIAADLGLRSGGPEAARALVDAHVGNVARARETANEGLDLVRTNPLAAPLFLRVLGFLELSLGDAGRAAPFLTSALEGMDQVRILEPGVLRIHGDAVEALVGVGDIERSEAVLAPWEEQGTSINLAWSLAVSARCRGLLDAARGQSGAALEALDRALVEHRRLPMPFELGRTLLVQGQIERRLKQRGAAKRSLEAALEVFERLGAPLWADKARAELARVGLRRSPDELTEGERRVAELAATGLTNREVAARLYMSPKTVEANLARVYRKLGIRSRAELGARLAGVGDAGPQT